MSGTIQIVSHYIFLIYSKILLREICFLLRYLTSYLVIRFQISWQRIFRIFIHDPKFFGSFEQKVEVVVVLSAFVNF